jgi:hypothetical protein
MCPYTNFGDSRLGTDVSFGAPPSTDNTRTGRPSVREKLPGMPALLVPRRTHFEEWFDEEACSPSFVRQAWAPDQNRDAD